MIFGDLDIAAARNILHNLGTDFLGSLCYQLLLILNVFGVEDDALQACVAATAEVFDGLGDVACRVEGHHFAGGYDEYLACVASADGHGKAAADYVA